MSTLLLPLLKGQHTYAHMCVTYEGIMAPCSEEVSQRRGNAYSGGVAAAVPLLSGGTSPQRAL